MAGVLLLLVLAGGYAAWQGFADVRDGSGWIVGAEPDGTGAASTGAVPGGSGTAGTPEPTAETIRVQIVGAVASPGIYEIRKGAFLDDLVKLAGGFTEKADKERINLVWRIERSLMIRIGEWEDRATPGAGGATGTSGAGAVVVVTDQVSMPEGGGEGENAGPLDINAATATQLDTLPGIGPSTAAAVVAYREKNGPFQKTEDLMKVSGIKQSRYDAIKDLVCVG